MHAIACFLPVEGFSRSVYPSRWRGRNIKVIFKRGRASFFDFVFAVVIDEVIAGNPNNPGIQSAGLCAVEMECSVHLQKNLLRQILCFIGSPREAVCEVVNPRVPVADDRVPRLVVSAPAPRYQLGVSRFQRSDSASTTE
jgi:hypothetical protein